MIKLTTNESPAQAVMKTAEPHTFEVKILQDSQVRHREIDSRYFRAKSHHFPFS